MLSAVAQSGMVAAGRRTIFIPVDEDVEGTMVETEKKTHVTPVEYAAR